MTIKYRTIPTTYEVYRSIVNFHAGEASNLSVYESYTNRVDHGSSTIYTVWGLKDAEVALVGARTEYERDYGVEIEGSRKHEYWLCAAYEEAE